MIYEIQNKNNTVRIANSMQGVARCFKENKVRGFSARTLKKTLKQGVEQMSKQGYTITRVHKRNKIKADIKFRKATYNTFTNSKRAMTQSLSFNSEIVLNEYHNNGSFNRVDIVSLNTMLTLSDTLCRPVSGRYRLVY